MRAPLLVLYVLAVLGTAHALAQRDDQVMPLLSAYATRHEPWLDMHQISWAEQQPPVYLGATPVELVRNVRAPAMRLPSKAKETLETHVADVLQVMLSNNVSETTFIIPSGAVWEVWPTGDVDTGQITWALGRFRTSAAGGDRWFVDVQLPPPDWSNTSTITNVVLLLLRPWNATEHKLIFAGALQQESLYTVPSFGNCVWSLLGSSPIESKIVRQIVEQAWILPATPQARNAFSTYVSKYNAAQSDPSTRLVCRVLPQPSRFNTVPVTFEVAVHYSIGQAPTRPLSLNITWTDTTNTPLHWYTPNSQMPPTPSGSTEGCKQPMVKRWDPSFSLMWLRDIMMLDGEAECVFPLSGRRMWFERKEAEQADNQLDDLIEFLEERYKELGVETYRHSFPFPNNNDSGAVRANLVARFPGADPSLPPVLVADHFDTAFAEDIYAKTGTRVSVPGADDNLSAVATLLRLAGVLANSTTKSALPRLKRDLLLVHLTGEEYPADDLGVRHLLYQMLVKKAEIAGLVLMDMISWRRPGDQIFQINAGASDASLDIARCAFDVASTYINNFTETDIVPAFRWRYDLYEYLYNTDGIVVSEIGFPVILINEHINGWQNINRKHYHTSTDTTQYLDVEFGTAVARVVIETALHLATR